MIKPDKAITPSITKTENIINSKRSEVMTGERESEVKYNKKKLRISSIISDMRRFLLWSKNKVTMRKNKTSILERKRSKGTFWG